MIASRNLKVEMTHAKALADQQSIILYDGDSIMAIV